MGYWTKCRVVYLLYMLQACRDEIGAKCGSVCVHKCTGACVHECVRVCVDRSRESLQSYKFGVIYVTFD